MADLKSQRGGNLYKGFLLSLVSNVIADLMCMYPGQRSSLRKDLATLEARVAAEGPSFMTKTLPKLGKALDRALETGELNRPKEFKSHGRKTIPAFMSGMFSLLFHDDGMLRSDIVPGVIRDLRQILFVVYKTEIPHSKSQERAVVETFCSNEQLLNDLVLDVDDPTLREAAGIVDSIFRDFNPKEIFPQHGPGAVATGEWGNEKWAFKRLYDNLHSYYPYYEYFMVAGHRSLLDRVKWYRSLERLPAGTAKVVLVPKDSRGPRLISCEPLEYQYIQQGLSRKMVGTLESHWLTKGQVNFARQDINRDLALISSTTREYATLDMKDASDLVSLQLVESLFRSNDSLLRALLACRTSATTLPDGRVLELKKFAPMGSALCFPIEAICFFSIAVATLRSVGVRDAHKQVYVYGDDIILPSKHALLVMNALERYGLTVNRAKSFITGYFRESCGCDAYRGVLVTPLRNKTPYISNSQDPKTAAQLVSLANKFASKGYASSASFLFRSYESTYGKLPYGVSTSPYLCRETPSAFMALAYNIRDGHPVRWNPTIQVVEIRSRYLKTRPEIQGLDGWERFLSSLLVKKESEPELVVRPRSTLITRGWRAAF